MNSASLHSSKKRKLYWILPVMIALLVSFLTRYSLIEKLELRLLDARFKLRGAHSVADSPFAIVAVDDQTFSDLNRKWPFPGSLHARLIHNLNRAGARLIVFDIEFAESNRLQPAEDSIFAAEVRNAGNVILAGKIGYDHIKQLQKPFERLVPPIPLLKQTGVPWGIVNEINDSDGFTRRYLLFLPYAGSLIPVLGLQALRALHQFPDSLAPQVENSVCRFGDLQIPLYDSQSFLINYYGPTGTFPAQHFASVLDDSTFELAPGQDSDYMEKFIDGGEEAARLGLKNPFAGKVILIGASAEELGDVKNTPFYDYEKTPRKMPGVEVHAHALQTIVDRSFIQRASFLQVLLCNLILAYFIVLFVAKQRPLWSLVLTVIIIGSVALVAILLFTYKNFWVDFISPLSTISFGYISSLVYNYLQELKEKARIRDMFSHYVPDKLVSQLIANPQLLKLGGERRRLTVLFADLVGFTSISEKLSPEELVELLNEYMTVMTEIVLAHDGIIDKYEGDLIMAEFGAPIPFENHASRSCQAALKMQQQLTVLRNSWQNQRKPLLYVRIGIHTGEVIVGNMGSKEVFDYTVLGDAVNLSSRLEGANKLYRTSILISQATREELPVNFVTRGLGAITVRGRKEAVNIYELVAEQTEHLSANKLKLLELFQQGREHFERREWHLAVDCFAEALLLDSEDAATLIYLERSQNYISNPPAADWDGVVSLEAK